jgi:hypothetical protein
MRFALLYHACPPDYGKPDHWDLLLEREGHFDAWNLWRLPRAWHETLRKATSLPATSAGFPPTELHCPAIALPPHRLHYFEYEGPLSDDRGTVRRYDRGTYRQASRTADHLAFELQGQHLHGMAYLCHRPEESPDMWELTIGHPPLR